MITIKASNLSRKFGDNTAVDGLNLEIEEGEIFGLVGPDGAGKTTTMRLLTGILEPTSGEGWVFGKHIVKESEELKENIAYMSQRFGLYEELTVLENINLEKYNGANKTAYMLPNNLQLDKKLGWLMGIYAAEGSCKAGQ